MAEWLTFGFVLRTCLPLIQPEHDQVSHDFVTGLSWVFPSRLHWLILDLSFQSSVLGESVSVLFWE